jgi:NTE family protein
MAGKLAVVLSGGGAKGAFQVGVLDQLITKRKVKVDIAVGTSTGSIQALAVAEDDLPKLIRLWTDIKGNDDIYRKRSGAFLAIINGKPSLYDASPLKALLKSNVDEARLRASGKSLRIGVVNLTTGEFQSVGENAPNIAEFVYASCAMPFAFEPLTTKAADGALEQWVDGGVRDVTPIDTALDFNPRGVLVIRASAPPRPTDPKRYKSLVSVGLRAVDILQSEVSRNDLKNVNLINGFISARNKQFDELAKLNIIGEAARKVMQPLDTEMARFRMTQVRVIEPTADFYDTLEFDPPKIKAAIQRGRDALEAAWDSIESIVVA